MTEDPPINAGPSPCRVAVLTPPGRGAVASLVVFGDRARSTVDRLFVAAAKKPLDALPFNRIHFGRWLAPGRHDCEQSGDTSPGEELLVVCRDSETIEVHCHGGSAAVARIVGSLTDEGCKHVDARVWMDRHERDRLVAEARLAIAQTRTARVAAILLDQIQGSLSRAVADALGYATDRDARATTRQLQQLLRWAPLGLRLTTPWRVVLVGPTNVGKSSLINAILGYQRALVCATAGTTRDVLSDITAMDGWPVQLADTAGLRNPKSDIERQAIRQARREAAEADCVLLITDLSQPWTPENRHWAAQLDRPHLLVHNKRDLVAEFPADRPSGIVTSARDSTGIGELVEAIARRLVPQSPPPGTAVPFLEHHCRAFNDALQAVQQGEYRDVRDILTGLLATEF